MGFMPRQVDEMDLWEFAACVEGWRAVHGAAEDEGEPMSIDRMRELGIVGV